MSNEYKSILVPNQHEPKPLDFDLELEEVKDLEDETEDTTTEVVETEKKAPKAKKKPVDTSEKDAQIQALAKKAKEAEEERFRLEQEVANLRKGAYKTTKDSKEVLKTTLEDSLETLNAKLVKAIEDGDAKETANLQTKISKMIFEIAKTEYEVQNLEDNEPTETKTQRKAEPPSEKALKWVEQHPEFETDFSFKEAALGINNTLIAKGYDPNSDLFYETLNKRLAKRFPDIYENYEDEQEQASDEDTESDEEVEVKPKKKAQTEQTVSGASRPASTNGKPAPISNKIKVSLTPEEQALAKKWGMSMEAFAKRKLSTMNKERGSYTEIKIN